MSNRNVDKGREAENAVAAVLREHGMADAERRSKRGGHVVVSCPCGGLEVCPECHGSGQALVPADAGDIAGIPGVVVQVKWSGYKPLAEDMRRTDEQRRVALASVGLLVRKRKAVGAARAASWDAYLPAEQLSDLMGAHVPPACDPGAVVHLDLATAAQLIAAAYRSPALA